MHDAITHDTLAQEWRRRMAARSTIGALLLAVPLLSAAAIGFSAGPGGLPFGISAITSGPSVPAASGDGEGRSDPVTRLIGDASTTPIAAPGGAGAAGGGSAEAPGGGTAGGGSGGDAPVSSTGSPADPTGGSGGGGGSGSTGGNGGNGGAPTIPSVPSVPDVPSVPNVPTVPNLPPVGGGGGGLNLPGSVPRLLGS